MIEDIKKDIEELTVKMIEWRRDFHRHPEVAFQETRTSQVLKKFMENQGIPVTVFAKTGLRGVLKGQSGGKTVALRADIDALPLKEEGDKEFISKNPEAAHACGHDGHMAILMGVIQALAKWRDRLPGDIVFLFQPSEERIPGGAKAMIEEGALEGVDAIFGLHLWQPLPTGKVGIIKGPMMAQPDVFTIHVKGKGGHGSMPQQTVDTILVASQIVVNCQSIVSRNIDPLKPAVVSFGTVEGGTIYNIIPGEVTLTGTVRSFDPEIQRLIEQRLKDVVKATCETFGAQADIKYEQGYPALVNDPEMVDFVREVLNRTLGEDRFEHIDPVMGGEDFSYFLQKVPGAFLFFGVGSGRNYPHHHPAFDLDETALPDAAKLLAALALEYLS
ncbi:MAG: amidohydrolase [Candidatus Aminicenantes bacterium]|nr:amidohydrolase [Candidatus Aminicenantes bacterium]